MPKPILDIFQSIVSVSWPDNAGIGAAAQVNGLVGEPGSSYYMEVSLFVNGLLMDSDRATFTFVESKVFVSADAFVSYKTIAERFDLESMNFLVPVSMMWTTNANKAETNPMEPPTSWPGASISLGNLSEGTIHSGEWPDSLSGTLDVRTGIVS